MRKNYPPPNVPYVEALHKGGKQKPTYIVIKFSGTTSDTGAALALANRWHKSNSPMFSSHYVVDKGQTIRCVWDNIVALHSEDEPKGSLALNVCLDSVDSARFWDDPSRIQVLSNAADLVAQLILAYKIPMSYLDGKPKSRRRSKGGILVQVEGHWPYQDFINNVRSQVEALRKR